MHYSFLHHLDIGKLIDRFVLAPNRERYRSPETTRSGKIRICRDLLIADHDVFCFFDGVLYDYAIRMVPNENDLYVLR